MDFKLIAALLDYPTALTLEIMGEIDSILPQCEILDEAGRNAVREFVNTYKDMDLLAWQQQYCDTFDIAPSTSLYLFEHVYGSSRKRGAAMSSLLETYRDHGLEISCRELPDYLPVYLDFVSTLTDREEALAYMADIAPILQVIHDVLDKHENRYALLIKPLLAAAASGSAHPAPENAEVCELKC